MSKETMEWLNNNTLIGMTDERGDAWHYMSEYQGDEANHYSGPIPIADLKRRLFSWEPIKSVAAALVPVNDMDLVNVFDKDGNPIRDASGHIVRMSQSNNRIMVVRSDNHVDLGAFKSSYEPHGYNEWLVSVLSNIIGDTLVVSSAGLLQNGAQAWVEASFPKTMHDDKTGFDYRPYLLATTSLNGTLATGYFSATNATVCDNTMTMAMSSAGDKKAKYRHTKHSGFKIEDARKKLAILHSEQENFETQLHFWSDLVVPKQKFHDIVEILIPTPEDEKESKKAFTRAMNRRDELTHVYFNDSMANTWNGTGLGVIQAVNTFAHHYAEVRGASRVQRNNEKKVKGEFADLDNATIDALIKVMEVDMPELVSVN